MSKELDERIVYIVDVINADYCATSIPTHDFWLALIKEILRQNCTDRQLTQDVANFCEELDYSYHEHLDHCDDEPE